jgi:hypothetical protein
MTDGSPKIIALDQPYVGMNASMVGVVAVKLRRGFDTVADLEDALTAAGIPQPNLVVWGGEAHCAIEQPQLLWLIEKSVRCGGRGRSRPARKLRGLRRRLVAALAGLGAVVESDASSLTVLNPLSPLVSCAILAPEPYQLGPTTAEHPRQQLLVADDGRAGNVVSLDDARDLFSDLFHRACKEVIGYHRAGDQAGFDARVRVLAGRLAGRGLGSDAAYGTAARVSEWVWQHHDPALVRERYRPCAVLVRGIDSVRERQAIGGRWAAGQVKDKTIRKLSQAIADHRRKSGVEPSARELVEATGLSKTTVYDRRAEAAAMADSMAVTAFPTQSPIYRPSPSAAMNFTPAATPISLRRQEIHVQPTAHPRFQSPKRADGPPETTETDQPNRKSPERAAA